MKFSSENKYWFIAVGGIFVVYFLAFFPIFNLHLVGDDYITVGVYQHYLATYPKGIFSVVNYIFSDWGVQDTIAYIFYTVSGFQPQLRYLFSFVVRFIAALSLIPLIFYITKNKLASTISALFFAITVIGIQTSDWAVTAPNFIAIVLLNLFLLAYFKLQKRSDSKAYLITGFLFIITIVACPTRMVFLPGFIILYEIYLIVTERSTTRNLARMSFFTVLFVVLLSVTHIGNSIYSRDINHWIEASGNKFSIRDKGYMSNFFAAVDSRDHSLISTSLKQFGVLVTPSTAVGWSGDVDTNHFVRGLVFLGVCVFIAAKSEKEKRKYAWATLLLMVSSLTIFWLKDPNFVMLISDRYLIVSAAAISILLGQTIAGFKNKFALIFALVVILTQFYYSYRYLRTMSIIRGFSLVEAIRSSVPCVPGLMEKGMPVLYYFEPDNSDTIAYSLTWGFNYILGYKCGISDIWNYDKWNFVATNYWEDVELAYKTGEFFTLFELPTNPVKLGNIYSYEVETDGRLSDTTFDTRNKLMNISNVQY